jgi:hypothetical protein
MLPQLNDPRQQLLMARRHADELRAEWRIANTRQDCDSGMNGATLRKAIGRALIRVGFRRLPGGTWPRSSAVGASGADSGC